MKPFFFKLETNLFIERMKETNAEKYELQEE